MGSGVARFFDDISASYANVYNDKTVFGFYLKRRLEIVAGLISKRPGGAVLDVGCGAGTYAEQVLNRGMSYTGIDLSGGMIQQCRIKFSERPKASFQTGDVLNLPFADAAFDIVLCLGVLEYVAPGDQDAAIAEVVRVLRPAGVVIFSFANQFSPFRRWVAFRNGKSGSIHNGFREYNERDCMAWLAGKKLVADPAIPYAVNLAIPPLVRWFPGVCASVMAALEPFASGLLRRFAMSFVVQAAKPEARTLA